MKIIPIAALLLAASGLLSASETRTEVVRTTTPAEDSKPNSPSVPDVYAIDAKLDRVIVLRFKYETDLLAGLGRMVKELHIRNAIILGGIGSVKSYSLHTVSNRTLPSKNIFFKDPDGPADIIGMSGYVIEGQLHPHITLADPNRAFGGHLEAGTTVFTFAAVTLGILADDTSLKNLDDKNYR
jgi:predicted DNA-binding protein with PD1-like motif